MSDRDYSIAEEVAAIAKEVGKTPAQGTSSYIHQPNIYKQDIRIYID